MNQPPTATPRQPRIELARRMAYQFAIGDVIQYDQRWRIERTSTNNLRIIDATQSLKPETLRAKGSSGYSIEFIHRTLEYLEQLAAQHAEQPALF